MTSCPQTPLVSLALRPYQQQALDAIAAAELRGVRRQLLALPTGAGKTVIFAHLIAQAQQRTLILVHRDELIRQTLDKLTMVQVAGHIGVVKAQADDHAGDVVVASIQTLARPKRRASVAPTFGLIVVDEAHHALPDNTYGQVLTALGAWHDDGPLVCGFTATPFRPNNTPLITTAQARGCFDEVVYTLPLPWMIEHGYLVPIVPHGIFVEGLDLDRIRTSHGDYSADALSAVMLTADTAAHLVRGYQEITPGHRALIFCPTVAMTYAVEHAFARAGIAAASVIGSTPVEERQAIYHKVRDGTVRALVNCMVLTEGFDEPSIDAIFMARPTKSKVLYTQCIGRGLRLWPGKDDCIIVDAVGATKRHDLLSVAALLGLLKPKKPGTVEEELQEQACGDTEERETGYHAHRLAQGVTSPETLEQARLELARIHPQAAAQLPQTYSKEAMVPFVKRAISVADNAKLQLETWKNQIEEQKLGVQLAQAGYQGLGTDVTSILRGLTPAQVQQFGGRTTPAAIAYATEEEKKRKLAQAGEAERLKFEQEQKLSATLPLQDARKEDAGLFVYKGTGQTVPGTLPYGQTKQLQDEQDPAKGVVKLANLDEKKQLTTLKQLEPVLQQYADLVQYAYGTDPKTGKKGPMADYQRGPFQTIGAMWNQLSQDDPVFQAKRRALQGQLQSVVRGLGARGDLNAQELEAAQQMLANMDASLGLGLSLGPMVGTGGIGVGGSIKPSISLPDTPETGINIANELIGTVNRRIGSILQHEGYAKTPYIRIRTDQESEPKPGEMPRATPPPKPGPEPVPAPGPPIFPRTQMVIPGEGTPPALPSAPSSRPTPPTATSTPAQDEAYRQSQGQGRPPAPAPSAPATRPTPGRQSQAPPAAGQTRVARVGAFKTMGHAEVMEAMRQTGKSRREVEAAARARGYTVYVSALPLPGGITDGVEGLRGP